MRQLRICSSIFLPFFALLLPAALHAGQRGLSCDQLRAELARQAQALKQQHADEMAQCESASGRQSQTCQDLSERQKEEMRQLKESTLLRLRGCNYSSVEFTPHHRIYYQNAIYPNRYYHHHHHHHYDHDGDGHHGHDTVRADSRLHNQGEHEVRAAHHASADSSLAAGAHPSNTGHVGPSLGHNGVVHSGFGTAWHGGSVYAAGASNTGGHVGSYSTGGGAMFSGGHGASYSGGYSGGHSGGGAVSSGHSGGFSGGSSVSSSTASSSSSSSSAGSSGGHVK